MSGAILGLDTTNAAGGNFTYGSVIADSNSGANVLGLTKLGAGTLTLTAASTYSGPTMISAGTIKLGVANALPAGTPLSVAGTLDLAGFDQQVSSVTGAGHGDGQRRDGDLYVKNPAADVFAGTMTGNLAFTKAGAGTLTLTAMNYLYRRHQGQRRHAPGFRRRPDRRDSELSSSAIRPRTTAL